MDWTIVDSSDIKFDQENMPTSTTSEDAAIHNGHFFMKNATIFLTKSDGFDQKTHFLKLFYNVLGK